MKLNNVVNRGFLFCLSSYLSPYLSALELSSSIATETTYTSNAYLTETNEVSEFRQNLEAAAQFTHSSRRMVIDANYLLNQRYYSESYDSESTAQGGGDFNFSIVPEVLLWNVKHVRVDTLRDVNANDTPENRSIRQTVETGPILTYSLSPRDFVQVVANRSWRYVEFQPENDSVIDNGSVTLGHQFSPLTTGSISISKSETTFDQREGFDLEAKTFNLRRRLKNGELALTYGDNDISQEEFVQEGDLVRVNLNLTFEKVSLGASFHRRLTHTAVEVPEYFSDDSGQLFYILFERTEIIEKDTARVNLSYQLNETSSVGLSGYSDSTTYQSSNLTADRKGAELSFDNRWMLTSSQYIGFQYSVAAVSDDYTTNIDEYIRHNVVMNYSYSINSKLDFTASLNERLKSGSNRNDYQSHLALINLTYKLF